MKSMKRKLSIRNVGVFHLLAMVTFVWTLGGGNAFAAPRFFSIGGGPNATTSYLAGAGLANLLGKKIKGLRFSVEETKGYGDNVTLVGTGKVEMAFTHPRMALEGHDASGKYTNLSKGNILALMAFQPSQGHIMTVKDSAVKTVYDLKGKRVAIGQPGGASNRDGLTLLEILGFTKGDLTILPVRLGEQVNLMKNGQVDAAIWFGTPPLPPIVDLAVSRPMVLVPIPSDVVTKLTAKYKAYSPGMIKAGIYKNQNNAVPTFQAMALFIINKGVEADIVYQVAKAMVDNLDELGGVHPSFKRMNKTTFLSGLPIPLHPGSVRFFKERGMLK